MEITLWHEQAEATLDSSMMLTLARPGAAFDPDNLLANIKRGRNVESYWTADNKPVLLTQELYGWLYSGRNKPSLIICGLGKYDCQRRLPPAPRNKAIELGTYNSGESEPF